MIWYITTVTSQHTIYGSKYKYTQNMLPVTHIGLQKTEHESKPMWIQMQ